ncbi:MAG TPA: hypothetical protein VL443_27835 [Cyclobacteriaceae bacterium]|jgi:hypothetical protein|nr:hypothetical protein [Cyclobacteriaceae bacterium]
MKTISKIFLPEILTNPINRDLILIFFAGLLAAITLVTASIIVMHQF